MFCFVSDEVFIRKPDRGVVEQIAVYDFRFTLVPAPRNSGFLWSGRVPLHCLDHFAPRLYVRIRRISARVGRTTERKAN
jgi:hypothetical protein